MNRDETMEALRDFVSRLRALAPDAAAELDPKQVDALGQELRSLIEPGELAALLNRGDLDEEDADVVFELEAFLLDERPGVSAAFPELGEVFDDLAAGDPPDPRTWAAAEGYAHFMAEVVAPAPPPPPLTPPATWNWARPLGVVLGLGAAAFLGTSYRPVPVAAPLATLISRPEVSTSSWLFTPEAAPPATAPAERPTGPEDRYQLALHRIQHGRYGEARMLLARSAAAGHLPSMHRLAKLHLDGKGGPEDPAQARAWFERAAEAGHLPSLNDLGVMWAEGEGGRKDRRRSIRLWREAAQKGHHQAMLNLGWVLSEGPNVLRDSQEAYDWYYQASLEGAPKAFYRMGVLSIEGRGIDQDDEVGAGHLRKAAELGHVPAMLDLSHLYEQGYGVERNVRVAVAWLRKAAQAGNAQARYELGRHLEQGTGVKQDLKAALDWYRQGAEQGEADCLFRLGELFEAGEGVPASPAVARDYFHRAAAAGHILAPARLEPYLDP